MIKIFKVVVEVPEDPKRIATSGYIEDVISSIYEDVDDIRYYPSMVTVEELPVASLSYMQSQPGMNPEYNDVVRAMEER